VDAGALGGDVHGAVMVDGEAVIAVEGGIEVGDHPHPQLPPSPIVSSAGGVDSSLPGQNGHGRPDSTSSSRTRGAKSVGRWARSATIVTHRPVS
jgi:hypothetical protein